MKFLRFSLAWLVLAALSLCRAAAALPLQHGEHLSFKVNWAIMPGAGSIKIDAIADPAAPDARIMVTTTTSTRRFARMLMPFDAKAESLFDLKTGKLISLHETSTQRDKKNEHTVKFDHARRVATYLVPGDAEPPRALPIPAGDPVDLIVALLQTRTWNLKIGESQDALVLFDDDFYELTIHAVRHEEVSTPLGRFKTLVLEPRMDKTPPKGMFKKGSSVRVWIAQDDQRLPVKFEVEFKIGTGTATLDAYEPPAALRGAKAPAKPAGASSTPDAKNSRP